MAPTTIDSGGVTLATTTPAREPPSSCSTASPRPAASVMGSRSLERSGHRVVAYDARPRRVRAAPLRTRTATTSSPTTWAVSTSSRSSTPCSPAPSMGAHTIAAWARAPTACGGRLHHPGVGARARRGRGVGPPRRGPRDGIEGFVQAYDLTRIPETWHDTSARHPPAPGAARAPRGWPTPCRPSPPEPFASLERPRPHRLPVHRRRQRRRGTRIPSASGSAGPRRSAMRSCARRSPGSRGWRGRAASSKVIADSRVPSRPLRSVPSLGFPNILGGVQNGASEGSRRSPFRERRERRGLSSRPLRRSSVSSPGCARTSTRRRRSCRTCWVSSTA